jgi:hypothetical protein
MTLWMRTFRSCHQGVGYAAFPEAEPRRHDADDRVAIAAQPDRLTDHVRPAAEARLPQAVAENHLVDRATDAILVVGEGASDHRLHAQQRKKLRRGERHEH